MLIAATQRGGRLGRGALVAALAATLAGMVASGAATAEDTAGPPPPPRSGLASADTLLPPPGAAAWRPLTFPSIDRTTRYEAAEADGRPIWRAASECSSSGMILPVEAADLARTPLLRWRWRVGRRTNSQAEQTQAGDDFAARVYVVFRLDPQRAREMSMFERMRRRVGERLYGQEMPGSSLNYVWANRASRGSDWPNPYNEANHMLALRGGEAPLATWQYEEVDLLADYRRVVGGSGPPELLALAIMSDSDDSCSAATAEFGDLRLTPRSAPPE